MKILKRVAIGLGVFAALLVGAYFALGQKHGIMLIIAGLQKQDVAPNRAVTWQPGPETRAPLTPGARSKPNVILIVADDLGINDLTYYGGGVAGGRVPTPHIDSLGRDGVAFTAGYAGNATCAPSRAAMMTGRYPTRFGFELTPVPVAFARNIATFDYDLFPPIYHADREDAMIPMPDMGVPTSEITIAQLLQGVGYHTIHLGKWHLGETEHFRPERRGFDESLGFYSGASLFLTEDDPNVVNSKQSFDPIDEFLWANLPFGVRYNGSEMFAPDKYMTDYLTDQAIAAMTANRNQPFFMYLAFNTPHTPLQATKEDYEALSFIEDHTLRVYAAMIRALDRNVGRLLAELKAQGLDENTIVIFTSDNGGANYIGLSDINKPYRGWKASFFEGGIRVPYFIRWPGAIPAGATFTAPVSHFDIFATAASAAGAPLPADRTMDGVDLVPFLTGAAPGRPHDTLFWRSGDYVTVQSGGWKLQLTKTPAQSFLYDMAADPTEQTNLATTRPDKLAELTAMIDAFQSEQVAPIWPVLVEVPVSIDHPMGVKRTPDETMIYWAN